MYLWSRSFPLKLAKGFATLSNDKKIIRTILPGKKITFLNRQNVHLPCELKQLRNIHAGMFKQQAIYSPLLLYKRNLGACHTF